MTMDWAAWSHEAVEIMSARSRALLPAGVPYRWDLATGQFIAGNRTWRLITIGTTAGDSFLWAWANDAIPPAAREAVAAVPAFGREHGLQLLTQPAAPGGLAQGKECLALAGRILDAAAIWVDRTEGGHIFFTLHEPSLRS